LKNNNKIGLPKKMQASIGLLLLGQVLLGTICLASDTCEAIVPTDTTAHLGDKAVLKCRLSSPNIAWTFCSASGGPSQIAVNCAVVPAVSDSYRLDKSNNGCNLVIDNVTASHYGTYNCQDLSLTDQGHTVELTNSDENLALNKNAIQSSGPGANKAVDGNFNPNYPSGSCTAAGPEDHAWWAVDLGQETHIGRVRITNRADSVPERLSNFFIGLTNLSPWITSAPKLANSTVCKYYTGTPPGGVSLDIFCEPNTKPGRYLYVMLNKVDTLTICELEAFYK